MLIEPIIIGGCMHVGALVSLLDDSAELVTTFPGGIFVNSMRVYYFLLHFIHRKSRLKVVLASSIAS